MEDVFDPLSEQVEKTRKSLADIKKAEYDELAKRIVKRYLLGVTRRNKPSDNSQRSEYEAFLATYREITDANSDTNRLRRIMYWLRNRQQREVNKILKDI